MKRSRKENESIYGMPSVLTLGIMGSSPGNGHPYSWAAICNGYDPEAMRGCPYPAIPAYLAERRFPADQIEDVQVTHVWTQDADLSRQIAAASLIPNIAARPQDMIGAVDAVLLARDDAANHYQLAEPFLRAGMPVYIDKPLATSIAAAERLLALESYPGQIFTGTPLALSAEFSLTDDLKDRLGDIRHINAVTPKYWETYAVHIIEPSLAILSERDAPRSRHLTVGEDRRMLTVAWASGVTAQFLCTGALPSSIRLGVFGTRGAVELEFRDSFSAFRTAIQRFCDGVRRRERMFDVGRCLATTRLIEYGCSGE